MIPFQSGSTYAFIRLLQFLPLRAQMIRRAVSRINICGTFQLVKFLLRRSPQARLIFTSTLSVYKPGSGVRHENSPALPETFYGLSKLYGERTVLHSGLQTAVFRLTSFYDSHWEARIHQRLLYDWIEKAIRGEDLVVWGSGAERRNYLHIQDVASAIRRCVLEWASGIYNIASRTPLRYSRSPKLLSM